MSVSIYVGSQQITGTEQVGLWLEDNQFDSLER